MARNDWNLLPGIIRRFHEDSALSNEQIIRGTFISMSAEISDRTPVDEGITRGNWYVTIDRPSLTFNRSTLKPSKGASEFESELGGADILGKTLYLTNNSPQILILENGGYVDSSGNPSNGPKTSGGYSVQAPNGMVRVTLRRFSAIIEEEAQ